MCKIAMHQECYGARNAQDITSWVCRSCETPDIEREYYLGPVKGGAQKPTDVEPLGVHVTCAWFKPEVCFASDEKMEPALRILSIPSNSFVKICVVCNMDLVHNAQSVPRIIMQRVHQGLATEWSYIPCKRMGSRSHGWCLIALITGSESRYSPNKHREG